MLLLSGVFMFSYILINLKKSMYLAIIIITALFSNISMAESSQDKLQEIIGDNITLNDIAYSKAEIADIKLLIISNNEIISDTYKTAHPQLSQEESKSKVNELIGSTIIQLNSLEESKHNPSDTIEQECYRRLDAKNLDKMIEIYNTILAENLLLNTMTNRMTYAPSNAERNKALGIDMHLFINDIINNTKVITFLDYCKEIKGNIVEHQGSYSYIEGLYYLSMVSEILQNLNDLARARYWLTQEATSGSNFAAAILGTFYHIDHSINIFQNNKLLKSYAIKYLKQGEDYAVKGGDPEVLYKVGEAYYENNRQEQAVKWLKVAVEYQHPEAKQLLNKLQHN